MAARKQAEEKDEDQKVQASQADEQAVDDRADGPIELSVEGADDANADLTETKDASGNVVAESDEGEKFSTLDHDEDDPSVVLPTPGGPGDEPPLSRVDKAEVLASVTKPEVTSQNPEHYTEAELNHRFTHIPPPGFVERKFPVKQ